MPTIKNTVAVPAPGRSFPLQGSQYEYLPFDARVEFAIVQTSATPGIGSCTATVYSGTDVLQQRAAVDIEQNKVPKYPDDFLLDDVAAAGERLSIELENSDSTNAASVICVVKITPL